MSGEAGPVQIFNLKNGNRMMRKDNRRRLVSTLLGVFVYLGYAGTGYSQTQAQSGTSVPPPSASTAVAAPDGPLGVTDQRHWQSFLKLAAKPNAMATLEDVENAFGQKPIYNEKQYGYEIREFLRYQKIDALKFRELYPDGKGITINLFFQDKDPSSCPSRAQLGRDLQRMGWKFLSHLREMNVPDATDGNSFVRHLPASDNFLKGDLGILTITYIKECPVSAYMRTDKVQFDLVNPHPSPEKSHD